jgi:hypothetical protein
MARDRDESLDRLRVLNEVLSRAAGSDPESAEHARRALEFFAVEEENGAGEPPDGERLLRGAEALARIHFSRGSSTPAAFAHWHVPLVEGAGPLWLRQAIVGEMKKLAGRRDALLLVTGLREAICPPGRYCTRARQAEYDRVRGWIDDLACSWAARGSRLQVVVV